jgi:hypothetical protein
VSCTARTLCTAVGLRWPATELGIPQPAALRWTGERWSLSEAPTDFGSGEFNAVSCTSATACTMVGDCCSGGSGPATGLAGQWNGTSWKVDYPGGALHAVSCASARACVAIALVGPGTDIVEAWNGSRWSIQPTPNRNVSLAGISCTSNLSCVAVGGWNGLPSGVVERNS